MNFDANLNAQRYGYEYIDNPLQIHELSFEAYYNRVGYRFQKAFYATLDKSVINNVMGNNSGDPFTVDFWVMFKSINNACVIGHEWYNGDFFIGTTTESDAPVKIHFATYRGSYGCDGPTPTVDYWHHVAVAREGSSLFCFFDGKKIGRLPISEHMLLASHSIDFNRQRDNDKSTDFVIDDFRISNIARWESDFDPSK